MSDRKWICADSYMKTALGFWGFFLTADNEDTQDTHQMNFYWPICPATSLACFLQHSNRLDDYQC